MAVTSSSSAPPPTALSQAFSPLRERPPTAAWIQNKERTNTAYRQVLVTHDGDLCYEGAHQDVAMALGYDDRVAQSLGAEVHAHNTQYFAVVEGVARRRLGPDVEHMDSELVREGQRWTVPPGWAHDVERVDGTPFRLFVQYMPPHHPPGRVDATRADAEAREAAAAAAGHVCAYTGCGAIGRYMVTLGAFGRFAFCSARHQGLAMGKM